MTSTTANNNPVTPQMIQSSAFQSVVRNQQSLESANGNVSSFLLTNVSAANSENLLSSIPNTRPHTNTDLVQQEQTISSSSPSSNLCSKIVRVLRDDDGTRRSESPSTAADCQKIANSASSSETNFSNAAVAPPLPPPSDCLARLETPDCLYFVCKKRLVIGRETAHSTADVSFKKTFVSRAHLELTFVASSMNAAAFAATTKDYDEAEEDDDDDETTSQDDGVWLLKCNGKNGILINNVQFNKDEAERVLPTECVLRFPSTDIQIHFWYSNSCRNFNQQQIQQSQLISPVTPVTTPAAEFDQNGVNCSSSSSLQTCSIHPEDPACSSSKLQDDDSRFKNCDDLDSSIEKSNNRTPSLDYDFEQADADESSDCDGFSIADDKDGKPPYSYAQLIVQAIASTEDKQMTLAGIYAYITKHYAYYRTCDKGWQNSIRHNLSLCRHFVRVPRSQDEPGKGSFWRIDPSCETKQIQTAYKKRRQGKNSICLASTSTTTSTFSTTTAPPPTQQNLNFMNSVGVGYPTSPPKQIDATAATITGYNNAPMNTHYVNGYGMGGNSSKTSSPVPWSSNENSKLQDILSPSSIDHYTRTFQTIDSNHLQTTTSTTTMSSIQRHSSSTDSFYSNQSSSLSLPFQRREDDGSAAVAAAALNSPSSSSTAIDRWNLKINQATTTRNNLTNNNNSNNKIGAVYCNGKDLSAKNEDVLARKNGAVSTVIEFAGDTTSKENEMSHKFSPPPPSAEQTATNFSYESSQISRLLPAQHSSSSSTPFYDERQASNVAKNILQTSFPNVIAGDVPSSRGDTIYVVNNRTASLKLPIAPKNETSSSTTTTTAGVNAASVHFKDDHLTHEYEPLEYAAGGGGSSSSTAAVDDFRRENSENENLTSKSNVDVIAANQNAVALSISPHLKNLMQENCAGGKFNANANSRFLSKSAPSSPKAYSKKTTSAAYQPTEKDLGRVHHHSTGGGTFSVRRSASDGRQRLQICHSPPFHVPVESAETSALRAMMQDSQAARSRRNSGQVAAASPSAISTARSGGGGVLSSVPSTLTAAASRIGSKSLSTTPTRELLAGTSPSRYEFVAQKTAAANHCAPLSNAGAAKRSTLDQLSAKQKALRFAHQRNSIDGVAAKTLPPTASSSSNVYVGGGAAAAAAAHQQTMVNNAFLQAGNTTGLQQALQHRSAPASPLNLLNFLSPNHHAAAAAVLAAGLTPPYQQQQTQQQQQAQAAQQRPPSTAAVAAAAAAAAANLANANSYANLLNNSNVTAANVLNNLVVAAAANQAAMMFPALGYDVANAASAAPLLAAAGLLPSAGASSSGGQSPFYAAALANNFFASLTSAAAAQAAAAVANDQQNASPSPNGESPSNLNNNNNNNVNNAAAMAAFLLAQRQRTQQQAMQTPTLALPTNLSPPAILLNGNNVVLGGEQGGGKRTAGDPLQQHFAPKMSRH